MTVRVLPGAAIDSTGKTIVLEAERTISISANNSGKPRIDLIYARYAEDPGELKARPFKQGGLVTTLAVNTQTIADPVISRIGGTPSDSPTPPSLLSATDIPLATVRVENGATAIDLSKISSVESQRTTALKIAQRPGGPVSALPWWTDGDPLLVLSAPASTVTLLMAQVTVDLSLVNVGVPFRAAIIEATPAGDIGGAGTTVGAADFTRGPGGLDGGQSILQTASIVGVATRPFAGVRHYRLKMGRGGNINQAAAFISSITNITLAALTL